MSARSFSNITGSASRVAEDAITHIPDLLMPYSHLVALQEKLVIFEEADLTLSGNISVKAQRRSDRVSSKSCNDMKWRIPNVTKGIYYSKPQTW